MKNLVKNLKSQSGFTMVELVMYLVVSGILFGLTANILSSNIDTYSFISNRKENMSNVRYAVNRVSYELLRVSATDVTAITADSISFSDANGAATDFHLDDNNLYRGNELLMGHVRSFSVTAYDSVGDTTLTPANARRYSVTITTAAQGDEGDITLSSTVTPRSYLYAGFE